MPRRPSVALSIVSTLALACGDGEPAEYGPGLRGRVAPMSQRSHGASHPIDQIWAIPVTGLQIDRANLAQKIVVEVDDQGNFVFERPSQGNYHYVMALISSESCVEAETRADWSLETLATRRDCVQGFVAVDGESDLVTLPVNDLQELVDLGEVGGGPQTGLELATELSLEDFAAFLPELTIDELEHMARIDGMLLRVGELIVNFTNDQTQGVDMSMNYVFSDTTPTTVLLDAFTVPGDMGLEAWIVAYDANVSADSVLASFPTEAGYLRMVPPAGIDNRDGSRTFGPDFPATSLGSATEFLPGAWSDTVFEVRDNGPAPGGGPPWWGGATQDGFVNAPPSGHWELAAGPEASPDVVASYDLLVSAPFSISDGAADVAQPLVLIPRLRFNTLAGSTTVESAELEWVLRSGDNALPIPYEEAASLVEGLELSIGGDAIGGCEGGEGAPGDVLLSGPTWSPIGDWSPDGAAGTCPLQWAIVGYKIAGNAFQFGFG
jgi:hypothetical protein